MQSQQVHITFYSMSQAVRKTSKRMVLEERKKVHEELFARNRRQRQMAISTQDQNFKVVTSSLNIDPTYRNLIEALVRRRYDRNRIMEYAELLAHEEIVHVYEGIVGLNSFGESVVSRETEENFLGSGVVPRLLDLVHLQGHPFLQDRSIDLLIHLAKTITIDNLRAFFNLDTIPISFFTQSLIFLKSSFNRSITLLQTLNNRSNFIASTDTNIHILDAIDACIPDFSSSDDTKEVAAKLASITRLLNTIDVHLWVNRLRFANRYYKIRQRIVSFYRKNNLSDGLCQQMHRIYEKQKMKAIANAIKDNQQDVPNIAQYIQGLIDSGFEVNFPYSSLTFTCFMITIIRLKETKHFLPHLQLLNRVELIINSKFDGEHYKGDYKCSKLLEICIGVIYSLLRQNQDKVIKSFLQKKRLLSYLGKLYEVSQEKRVICQLNTIVRLLISDISKSRVLDVLLEYKFIQRYFKNSLRFNQMTMKGALKYLMWNISTLKRNNIGQYETIRKIIVNDEIYESIRKIKSNLYLNRVDDIFQFYDGMREQERPSTQTTLPGPKIDLQENSSQSFNNEEDEPQDDHNQNVIQVLDEPDDLVNYLNPQLSRRHFVIDVDEGTIVLLNDD